MARRSRWWALVIAPVWSACATFEETYHLKATGARTNYYRVEVSGFSLFSASQYAAGSYDGAAVDALFGELEGKKVAVDRVQLQGHKARSAGGEPPSSSGAGGAAAAIDEERSAQANASSDPGAQKLVFFLSTNSDFLIDQIQGFVSSRNIQEALKTLLMREDREHLERSRSANAVDTAQHEHVARSLAGIAAEIEQDDAQGAPALDNQAAIERAVRALRRLAESSSASATASSIRDLASARAWLAAHPQAFARAGGAR